MIKKLLIVCLPVCFAACASQTPPLDDAYYWPDKKGQIVQTEALPVSSSDNQEIRPSSPDMEIISQQDTTITVRIKR